MDFELMINSLPKLLNATLITLKLLSASLIFGLFIGLFFAILRVNKKEMKGEVINLPKRIINLFQTGRAGTGLLHSLIPALSYF